MNATTFTAAHSPVARMLALMSQMLDEALARRPVRPTPVATHRCTGPAAEMLRTLAARNTLAIEQPLGLEVVCLKGTLWITHDDDTIDHVVESGQTYVAKRGGKMLIHALTEARFIVEPNDD